MSADLMEYPFAINTYWVSKPHDKYRCAYQLREIDAEELRRHGYVVEAKS